MASEVRLMSDQNKLTSDEFTYVSKLIREKSAIVLEPGKEYLVESRLTPVAKALEFDSISALVRALRTKRDVKLIGEVVDAMTTNETLFFRDRHPFEALQEEILPDLIQRRAKEKTLNIWCAASSSGQEPYSVCILLRENFPQLHDWKINFLTTDISPLMLERTKAGVYSQLEVNRGMPAKLMVKYFKKDGAAWQIAPELRNMLEVKPLNLSGHWGLMPKFDIVFIRNVLIYFDAEVKKQIMGKIRKLLTPGGIMFLGGSETTINIDNEFDRVRAGGTWIYKNAA